MALSIEAVKSLVLGGLFVLTFFFSSLPVKFYSLTHDNDSSHDRRSKRAISFLSCFAAGVFLATCLLHLFPDVDNQMTNVMDRMNVLSSFPVSEFIMCFGFFLILVIEQVVLTMKERNEHHHHDDGHHHHHRHHHNHTHQNNHLDNDIAKPLLKHANKELNYGLLDEEVTDEAPETNSLVGSDNGSINEPFPTMTSSGEYGEHADHSVHMDQSSHSTVRSFILLLALSLHAVFEGLAVGLQRTSADVIQIFSALVLHKCILGFSLGLNLVQSRLSKCSTLRATFAFSIMSPLGIAVGILVDDYSNSISASAASGILQGIACGTFLYVTFFEVLPHEFNSKDDRMLKVLFLILGYSTLVAILFLNPDNDSVPRHGGSSQPVGP